jgi:hypothetical protein
MASSPETTPERPPLRAAARTLSVFLRLALVRADRDAGRLVVCHAEPLLLTSWQGWPVEAAT